MEEFGENDLLRDLPIGSPLLFLSVIHVYGRFVFYSDQYLTNIHHFFCSFSMLTIFIVILGKCLNVIPFHSG